MQQEIIDRFDVGLNSTRVAIISFATTATVDVDGIGRTRSQATADRCSLYRQLGDSLHQSDPEGHSATGEALRKAYDLLLDSRPGVKKAVIVITDGRCLQL